MLKISSFGDLKELNNSLESIYSGNLYTIIAPATSGKKKFSYQVVYKSMVKYGQNVVLWTNDITTEQLTAEFRSIHFSEYYKDKNIKLSAQDILNENWPSLEVKGLEEISCKDFILSGKYGELQVIRDQLYLETFETIIKKAVSTNNSSLVYIDSLSRIYSSKDIPKYELNDIAYQKASILCKELDISLISIIQPKEKIGFQLSKCLNLINA